MILIFPRNAMARLREEEEEEVVVVYEEDRGLRSLPASLVLQSWGDGSPQPPSENHAL